MTFHLKASSLDWALTHIERYGDTDIFPVPFEFETIRADWANVRAFLVAADLSSWVTRKHRRAMTPKGRYSYRSATQLDPLDSLILTACVYEIGSELESYRVPLSDKIVLSHRFDDTPKGRMYSIKHNWGTFLKRSETLASKKPITHVVMADIADFYPRLYHHRIENTLRVATGGKPHVPVIMKFISDLAEGSVSFGLPVGPAATRILADVTINDVDETLRSEGAKFCRYSDDYRIFCKSHRDAYERLELLATNLHRDHGLTLQSGKTRIVEKDEFLKNHLSTPAMEELGNLYDKFRELLKQLGLEDTYEDIDYDDLSDEQRGLIDELNLEDLLRQQVAKDDQDIGIMKFALRRLGQLDDKDVVDEVLDSIDECYPVVAQVIKYLLALHSLTDEEKAAVGKKVIEAIRNGLVGHSPYHRAWLLSIFADDVAWNNKEDFVALKSALTDDFSDRKLILALGRSGHDFLV